MNVRTLFTRSFNALLSSETKERVEQVILVISILSYLIHLMLILLNTQGIISLDQKFFKNPIAAVYTPFSFILLYEVYLLVYFLPKSFTIYIGKQYEIITLIVIRRIFKDIAYVELTTDWFNDKNDLQFTFDALTSLLLFFLIFLFYRSVITKQYSSPEAGKDEGKKVRRFIQLKKIFAIVLVPILAALACYALTDWGITIARDYENGVMGFKKINNVFFDEFFGVLIVVDVLLLLTSFFLTNQFHKTIRNSGFIISTVLIKVSFLAEGIVNNLLIIGAVLFGYLLLLIHNQYEKKEISSSG